MRTYRVNQMLSVTATEATFEPDPEFDVSVAWERFLADFRERLTVVSATVRLTAAGAEWLRTEGDPGVVAALGAGRPVVPPTDDFPDGSIDAVLTFESDVRAVSDVLRLGAEAELLGPPELRRLMGRAIHDLAVRYPGIAASQEGRE